MKTAITPANALGAQKYLREAVRLDPKFALSWALLSYVDSRGYLSASLQPTVALREEARQAAETALTLQPNLGEAILAKGAYHYFCLKDYDTAVHYFEQARQFLPNSSRIPESLAYVARRRGQWDRSESYFNEAERLDPRNVYLLTQHAYTDICLRRFPEALRKPVPFRSRSSPEWRRVWGNPTAPSPLYRNCSRFRTRAHSLQTCRSLPRCSGSRSDV